LQQGVLFLAFSISTWSKFVMAESVILTAKSRNTQGTHEARRMRRSGLIPGVVYGHKEATIPVTVQRDDLFKVIRHGVRVVDLQADGKTEKALIREVQWDHLGLDILHVDFARVAADERIKIEVRIELRGTAPGVTAGGVLDQPIHSLVIECLAIAVPESIRVPIGELLIGQAIHVKELVLPEGVTTAVDPDAIVVQVAAPKVEEEVAAAAPVAEQAEPELIGRKEKPEEEAPE
jgi:large subunit ribosomal protein L25